MSGMRESPAAAPVKAARGYAGPPAPDGTGRGRAAKALLAAGKPAQLSFLAGLVVIFVIPALVPSAGLYFWETVVIAVVFASSVNLLVGYSGVISFGQAAFYGTGAYVAAQSATAVPVVVAVLLSGAFAGLAGLVVGVIARRATGVAFAMSTLAVAELAYVYASQSSTFGGETGESVTVPGWLLEGNNLWYLVCGFALLCMLALYVVARSPMGYTLRAMRDDRVRLTHLGTDVQWLRIWAFTISCAVAGIAGGLYAFASQTIDPSILNWSNSGQPIVMSLVGGISYFAGPGIGAVILTYVSQQLTATTYYDIILGVVLLVIVLGAPQGLLGLARPAWQRAAGLKPRLTAAGRKGRSSGED